VTIECVTIALIFCFRPARRQRARIANVNQFAIGSPATFFFVLFF